jgi:sugar/nucleoside kinase (ribokinase family)
MADLIDLIVLGEANPDLVLLGDVEPAFGERERLVEDAHLTVGGSGAILACGAARLGLHVVFCGVVGNDPFGLFMRDELERRGVDVSGLVVDPEGRTGVTVVLGRSHDRAILTHEGTIGELRADLIDPRLLGAASHVHVSSYFLQRRLTPDLARLFGQIHSRAATTSIDPNGDPSEGWDGGLRQVLPLTDVFLPNAAEAIRIAGTASLEEAVRSLAALTSLVVVKAGPDGAVAVLDGELVRAPARSVETVDTTGAGDGFDAGFLASWLAGEPLERALAIANACGALSTRALGGVDAQPTLAEALGLVEEDATG